MKKLISLLVAMMLISSAGMTQKLSPQKVPQNVRKAFTKQFPRATQIAWAMKDSAYNVNFLVEKIKYSAVFDKNARLLEKLTSMKVSDLPKEVKNALKKEFQGFKATEAEKLEKNNLVQYNVVISKKTEILKVQVSPGGEVVSKETVPVPEVQKKK